MKKYIILSVNDNQDYLYYTPLTCWAWRHFGWEPILLYQQNEKTTPVFDFVMSHPNTKTYLSRINPIEGYRSDTVTQVSRLYGAVCCYPDDLVMTGDIDMIPLSDYWKPETDRITIYGYDLTGFKEYPICYISALGQVWRKFMHFDNEEINALIKRDLDTLPNAKSEDFYTYWGVDQQFVTERINQHIGGKEIIGRGQYPNGYAKGRVDRGAWSLEHEQMVDCHMHRDLFKAFYPDASDTNRKKWSDTMRMLEKCFPGEDFTWLEKYTKDYAALAYGK